MIPNGGKIIGATCWIDGNSVPGAEEVTVPDFNMMTTEINPLGSNGVINMPIPKFESMQCEIRSTFPSAALARAAMTFGSLITVDVRGTYQITDPVTGGVQAVSDLVVMTCKGLGMGMGSQSNSDGGERTARFELVSIKYYADGDEIFRWSGAPNNEFVVDGVDYMAEHRANLGI